MWYFLVLFNTKIIKSTKIIITSLPSLLRAKTLFLISEKSCTPFFSFEKRRRNVEIQNQMVFIPLHSVGLHLHPSPVNLFHTTELNEYTKVWVYYVWLAVGESTHEKCCECRVISSQKSKILFWGREPILLYLQWRFPVTLYILVFSNHSMLLIFKFPTTEGNNSKLAEYPCLLFSMLTQSRPRLWNEKKKQRVNMV